MKVIDLINLINFPEYHNLPVRVDIYHSIRDEDIYKVYIIPNTAVSLITDTPLTRTE